jgi:signal peptidase I
MAYSHKQHTKKGFLATVKEIVVLLLIVFVVRTFVFGLYQVPTGSMETTMLIGERFFADKFTPLFKKPQRGEIIAFNDPVFKYSSNPIIRLYQEYVGWPIWPWGPANWTKRVIGVPGDHVKGVVEDGKPVVYLNGEKLDEPYLNQLPLLGLWSCDPEKVRDERDLHDDWRSYDPSKGFNDQVYYRVNEKLILRSYQLKPEFLNILEPITVTADSMLLKEPNKQIEPSQYRMIKRSEGYWTWTDDYDVTLGENQYWLMGDNRRGSHDCRCFGPVDGRLIHGRIVFRIWSIDSQESWWILDLIKHPIDFWKRMRWNRFFQRV